jgi:hypothetical protein
MSFSPSASSTFNSREQSVETLAYSFILLSITENVPLANIDYHSRLSSPRGSDSSLDGWGTTMTRKTYKTGLALMASARPMDTQTLKTLSMQNEDAWGHFSYQE